MSTFAGILIQRFIATILVVSVSICCCQAKVLLHASSDQVAVSCGTTGATPSCCTPPAPDSSEDDTPGGDGCKSCCFKGTGLKDAKPVLPKPVLIAIPMLATPATLVTPAVGVPAACSTDASQVPYFEPPTLVRLHCALLV